MGKLTQVSSGHTRFHTEEEEHEDAFKQAISHVHSQMTSPCKRTLPTAH